MPEQTTRRLAAILFADIAGYTSLMQHDERVALQKLARFKEMLQAKTAEFQGNIIQYYGDGCLVVFDSPVAAVACAEALQRQFQQAPTVPVRIGLHLGDVVFKEGNVFGDAVNIASRIESMGVPGAVLLSQTVRRQVKNQPEFQLASLGSFEFKNVDEPMEVFALANDGFPVPKREEMEGKLKAITNGSGAKSGSWKRWAWVAGIGVAALAGLFFLLKNSFSGQNAPAPGGEKSIALLPFRNESADQEQTQYFCNGVMESILNHLSQIGELHVISRQSIERYRGSDKPVAEIARELGVAYLLEGSVQRAGERVKIYVQLIHAESDRHLWSQEFGGDLDDIFALQSAIAAEVAGALQTKLSLELKSRFQRVPTTNLEAWNIYLQAQAFFGRFGNTEWVWMRDDTTYFKTISLCDQALALDPGLAEAWTLKAQAWWARNYWREIFEEHYLDSAAAFARKALALDPNSAMAHTMLGNYFNETGQPEKAMEYLEKALLLNPNHIESLLMAGRIYADNAEPEKAYQAAIAAMNLAAGSSLAPDVLYLLSSIHLNAAADLDKAEYYLKKAKLMSEKPKQDLYGYHMWLYTLRGDLDNALLEAEEVKKIDSIGYPTQFVQVYCYRKEFGKAVALFEQMNEKAPHQIVPALRHRWAQALLETGQKEKAKAMFRQAEEGLLQYVIKGRKRRNNAYYDLAGLHACQGNKEQAWHYLRKFDEQGIWVWGLPHFIQVDPLFENLRTDPEFKEMVQRVFAEKKQMQARMRQWETEGR